MEQRIQKLQDQVNDLYNKDRKALKWVVIILILVLVIVTVFLCKIPIITTDPRIDALEDSIKIHDAARLQTEQILSEQNKRDSIRTLTLRNHIEGTDDMVRRINHKYEIQRHNINALTDDEQFSLFSEWLSQTDSL